MLFCLELQALVPFCWFCEARFDDATNPVAHTTIGACFDFDECPHQLKRVQCYGWTEETKICSDCSVLPINYLKNVVFKFRDGYSSPDTQYQGQTVDSMFFEYKVCLEFNPDELIES